MDRARRVAFRSYPSRNGIQMIDCIARQPPVLLRSDLCGRRRDSTKLIKTESMKYYNISFENKRRIRRDSFF